MSDSGSEGHDAVSWSIPVMKKRINRVPFATLKRELHEGADPEQYDVAGFPGVDPRKGIKPTQQRMRARKVLDVRRLFCAVRPQYKYACGISSLVGAWNYLYSTVGAGNLEPYTIEEALTVIGLQPPFSNIRFGPFTGNGTLITWFRTLCRYRTVAGRCGYLYKPAGRKRTLGVSGQQALERTAQAVSSERCAVIYHCANHYALLIGYDATPNRPVAATAGCDDDETPCDPNNTWFFFADSSRTSMPLRSVKWQVIDDDLNCVFPEFINVRQLHKGIQRKEKKAKKKALSVQSPSEEAVAEAKAEEAGLLAADQASDKCMVAEEAEVHEETCEQAGEHQAGEAERQEEAERKAEETRLEEERKAAEEAAKAEQARLEAERLAEEARKAEAERRAEEVRLEAERQRVAKEAEEAERKAKEEADKAEAARIAAEEAERLAVEAAEAERALQEAERVAREEVERKAKEARVEAERVAAEAEKAAKAETADRLREEAELKANEAAEAAREEAERLAKEAQRKADAEKAAADAEVAVAESDSEDLFTIDEWAEAESDLDALLDAVTPRLTPEKPPLKKKKAGGSVHALLFFSSDPNWAWIGDY